MRLQERYRRLTIWNKIAFWGSVASIIALILAIAPLFRGTYQMTNPPRNMRLTPKQKVDFVETLKAATEPKEGVRLGCAGADEQACVLAGDLLDLFQKAGWTVRSDGVERVRLSKPKSGVVLLKRGATTDPPPTGSGVWVLQTPSLLTVERAFKTIGINTEKAADATMPEGVIGVFIGPSL